MTQYARPNSDISAGTFTASPLYEKVGETTPSDAQYILSNVRTAATPCVLSLNSITDPNASTGHVIRFRACLYTNGSRTVDGTVTLLEGSTQRAAITVTLTASFADYSYTLSGAEADAISDYGNLRLQFMGLMTGGSGTQVQVRYSWAAFETPDASSGTTYNQAVSGSLTGAGGMLRQGGLRLAGGLTGAGAQVREARRGVVGSLTAAGAVIKQMPRSFAGVITGSGALATSKFKLLVLTGTLTLAGALLRRGNKGTTGSITGSGGVLRQAGKRVAGTVTGVGSALKRAGKGLAGTLTGTGALGTIKTKLLSLAGSLTASGAVRRMAGKLLSGAVTGAGALAKQAGKRAAGSITGAGAVAAVKAFLLTLAGSLTPVGALRRQVGKVLAGSLTVAGALRKQVGKGLSGVATAIGDILSGTPPLPAAVGLALAVIVGYLGGRRFAQSAGAESLGRELSGAAGTGALGRELAEGAEAGAQGRGLAGSVKTGSW